MGKARMSIAMISAGVIMLAGCGNNLGSEGPDDPEAPVELRFALWDEVQVPTAEKLIAAFNENYPHITVQIELTAFDQYWTKLETGATGRNAPDVFWTAPAYFQRYAVNDIMADLGPLIERDNVSLEGIYPVLIDAYTFRDGFYAIPKDIDNIGLWYNTELFDQAGLDYPDETWTWETLLDAAIALTDSSDDVWGIAAQGGDGRDRQSYYNTIPQAGGQIIQADGTSGYASAEAIEGVQFWVDMIQVHEVSPTVEQLVDTSAENLFMTGRVAMLYDGSWRSALFGGDSYTSENINVALLPLGPNGTRQSSANGLGYAMYAESPNQEAAWEFLKFLATPEASSIQAEAGAVIPAHESEAGTWIAAHPQYNLEVFIEMAAGSGEFLPVSIDGAVWREEARRVFQRAYLGEITVEEAAELVAESMNEALEREQS